MRKPCRIKEGDRVGSFLVLKKERRPNPYGSTWFILTLKCDCGRILEKPAPELTRKDPPKKCRACAHATFVQACTTHGHNRSPNGIRSPSLTYRSWSAMKARCNGIDKRERDRYYKTIRIDDPRWHSFENFLADMDERPSKLHSIDRIDNEKGYSKLNCRWTTPYEQSNNRRNNVKLTAFGVTLNRAQWSKALGLGRTTIRQALKRGHTLESYIRKMKLLPKVDAIRKGSLSS